MVMSLSGQPAGGRKPLNCLDSVIPYSIYIWPMKTLLTIDDGKVTNTQQAQIRIALKTGKLRVTDENGKPAKRLSRKEAESFREDSGTYIATGTIFQAPEKSTSNPKRAKRAARKKCVVIYIGGTAYKVCS
jgi:hypothetical protein